MDVPRLLRPLSRVPRWAIFGFALTGLLLQAFGLYWDIWRHVVVGRESFFTPPHLVLYAGFGYVALAGIVGSIAGASAPRWAGPRVRIVGLLVPIEFFLIGTGVLILAVLAGRRAGLGTLSAAAYTGLRSLMIVGQFALPPPVLFLAPVVDLAFLVLRPRRFGLIAATLTGGAWAVLFYVVYLILRGFAMDPLFVGLFSFTVFIAGVVGGGIGF